MFMQRRLAVYAVSILLAVGSASLLAYPQVVYADPATETSSSAPSGNVVHDENLKMRINMSELERDDPTQDITAQDLAGLTYLDLTGAETDDWSFMQYCTRLETLLLGNTNFSDARLLETMPLDRLVLSHTAVDHLDALSRITTLTQLDLSEIESADEHAHEGHDHGDGHEHGGVVDAQWLQPLTNLVDLRLLETEIEHAEMLASLTRLEVLDISHTEGFDPSVLSSMPQLRDLQLDGVHLDNVSALAHANNLEILRANNTDLQDISPLANATRLRVLELAGNPISDISALANLRELQELQLNRGESQDGEITDISALSSLTKLVTLNLDNNDITSLEPLAQLRELQHLRVTGNNLKSLSGVEGMTSLVSIEAARNPRLSDISALADLTTLDGILLDGSAINDIRALSNKTSAFSLSARNQELSFPIYALNGRTLPARFTVPQPNGDLPDGVTYGDDTLTVAAGTDVSTLGELTYTALGGKYSATSTFVEKELHPSLALNSQNGAQSATVTAGSTVNLHASGFLPGEQITFVLHSDPVNLGTATADENGAAEYTTRIPSNTSSGAHTITATGETSTGSDDVAITVQDRTATGVSHGKPAVGSDTQTDTTPENRGETNNTSVERNQHGTSPDDTDSASSGKTNGADATLAQGSSKHSATNSMRMNTLPETGDFFAVPLLFMLGIAGIATIFAARKARC